MAVVVMGVRGKLAEFTEKLLVSLSEAQRYKLEALALKRNDTKAGTLRSLIDEEWERDAHQAPED